MRTWLDRFTAGASGFLATAEHEIRDIAQSFAGGRHGSARSALDRHGPAPSTVDVLTLDISYSMDDSDYPPSRLHGAIQAAMGFLKQLEKSNPKAWAGIVTFAGSARVVAPPAPVHERREALQRQLRGLSTDACTNIGAGLQEADRVLSAVNCRGFGRIILLTDGHSNEGPDPQQVASQMKKREVQLDIVGIGGSPDDVDEPRLKRMASVVNGELRYWFIRDTTTLIRKFESLALRKF
jgi:Mg-chelatase subunit ChlD